MKKGLGMTDIIPNGKFSGCRVDSIIAEDFEYIIYMQMKAKWFSKEVVDKAYALREHADSERHYNEEVAPYFDDIPF